MKEEIFERTESYLSPDFVVAYVATELGFCATTVQSRNISDMEVEEFAW